uniref:Putative conserved secreted protein n=1 Tax=Ixodes ricinus TaxID=34613 RepID=V5H2P9_IXORI
MSSGTWNTWLPSWAAISPRATASLCVPGVSSSSPSAATTTLSAATTWEHRPTSFSVSGLEHFHKLLMNTAERLKSRTSKSWHAVGSAIQGKPLVLIGFSKGCVVLNQVLYAIKALELNPDDDLCAFVGRIREMYWLDGGHSGGSNTWVTKEVVLKAFAQLNIKVNIHVTPYQVLCNSRPWIGKEEKGFREMLKKLGMDVSRKLHYADEQPSLDMHFKLLEEFMPCAAPVR